MRGDSDGGLDTQMEVLTGFWVDVGLGSES